MAEQVESKDAIMAKLTNATKRIGDVHQAMGVKNALGGETETAITVQGSQPLSPSPGLTGGVAPGTPKG